MDLSELNRRCLRWDGSDEEFAKVVAASVQTLGLYQRELAAEFEVAESTVSRWASGIARPLPRMRRSIVEEIQKRAARALKAQQGPSSSTRRAARSR
jgi:ribosome-binding protein aMBF1 (putative translation factor)